ncbi:MAG: M48 family metallopeptidase [Opitutales bacterium]|nr:M48 family metallopeptidase [Opitutales bacterium]
MDMNSLSVFVLILILARYLMVSRLEALNRRHAIAQAGAVPERARSYVDEDTYAKSIAYTLDKSRAKSFLTMVDTAVLACVLYSGVLPWFYRGLELELGRGVAAQALILLFFSYVMDLLDWPGDCWVTFKVEAKHGFNKSGFGLWIADKLKGMAVSSVIMYPVFCVLLWLVSVPLWWIWAFAFLFVFQLLMMVLYPMFIMPLFNKFTPLEEGELKERLMSLAQRTGFHAKTILVMDGSRRSGHSNAFFTGIGKSRRVVLFDTLVEQLEPEELEAVLAHEIGHYKMGHIPRGLALSGVLSFAALALIGWLASSPWFVASFGFSFDPQRLAPVLMLFSLMAGLGTFWFTPFMAMISRRHEYQADAFARKAMQGDPKPLIGALRKLHTKNLGNLVPHPLYSAFYYSHPTLSEREEALEKGA